VGANVGLFCLSLIDRFSNLQLYCFEPVPATRACLTRNLSEAGALGACHLTIIDAAIGDGSEQAEITYFPASPGNATVHVTDKFRAFQTLGEHGLGEVWATRGPVSLLLVPFSKVLRQFIISRLLANPATIPCRMCTLSDAIREHHVNRIDLLKIDVEGAELDVLRGIEESHWPLIRQISMETTRAQKPLIRSRLSQAGFTHIAAEDLSGGDKEADDYEISMIYAALNARRFCRPALESQILVPVGCSLRLNPAQPTVYRLGGAICQDSRPRSEGSRIGDRDFLEQGPFRRTHQPPESHQAPDVLSSWFRTALGTGASMGLKDKLKLEPKVKLERCTRMRKNLYLRCREARQSNRY
jgi:FkbM family methyltransferase